MGLQKYRVDRQRRQSDGALLGYAEWLGGPSLSKIGNCRLMSLQGHMRRTVYITGEPDTWFSQPAVTKLYGCVMRGYVTDDGNGDLVFHHCYY